MAPAPGGTPGRKTRGGNKYFDVGVQGRKTGITLEDKGIRDEYGMEPLDGIFSSPEKSPPKRPTGRRSGGTVTTSESMEVQESSVPEPTQTIKSQNLLRKSKTFFPPPVSRSPMKTNLGSSPRRQSSMGPRSAARKSMGSPDRSASHPAVSRRLDFSVVEEGPTSSTVARSTPVVRHVKGGQRPARPDIYDLQESPVRGQKRTYEESIVEEDPYTNGNSALQFNGLQEESLFPPIEDESLQFVQGAEDDDNAFGASSEDSLPLPEVTPPPAKKSRTGKTGRSNALPVEDEPSIREPTPKATQVQRGGVKSKAAPRIKPAKRSSIAEESSPAPPQPRKSAPVQHSSKLKKKIPEPEPEKEEDEEEGEVEDEIEDTDSMVEPDLILEESTVDEEPKPMPPPQKRGRPAKNKVNVHRDQPSSSKQESRFKVPAIPQKRAQRKPKPKPVPSERDPNVRSGSVAASQQEKGVSKAVSEASSTASTISRRPPIVRGLQQLRQGTPFEDVGMRTTRSGRASVKPVDFWRGETIKYDHLRNNVEIVRADNRLEFETAGKRKGAVKPKRRAKVEEDVEHELDDWEVDPGSLTGTVTAWDSELGVATNDHEEQELAIAEEGVPFKDVSGGQFQFAKLISVKNFFGAGIINLPPGGFKRPRNARQMQFAFYLFDGTAEVTIADERFTIHKGGYFQVPRG
ncbi:uncharacterized protein BDZ99DRAFT_475198 [Mytilinidion resinicola]|uniref:Mif2/CENP-C cupin domain-containing protein n=1 Tax=Mytilinidion resinicola TaxID=574789 RepID=A0A6A6YSB6_9PEZI|nr:uncharacterized protein BDZ99DRAFT_475198 [Mytilinidion resinicola]KAF2811671.1 hypothetical protein BDZ99DRAFT_475198 [Mytilinidion resinicola]